MNLKKNILITGGAGFIGSNLMHYLVNKYSNYNFINFDKLTYASNFKNIEILESKSNYKFIKGDICQINVVRTIFKTFNIDSIIHLAAESHVDNSIENPNLFAEVNVLGTLNLLELARENWGIMNENNIFYHISTDEVFGSLNETGKFSEISSYDPRSPYSSSKASSDHFVRAYYHTYNLPVIISNCSNNFGRWQHSEKLIPKTIKCLRNNSKIPIYGNGKNVRDWIYVEDHLRMIDLIFHEGNKGETYCLGSNNEFSNIDLVYKIIDISDRILGKEEGYSKKLIEFVKDRPGHDLRYAIDSSKFLNKFKNFKFSNFDKALEKTVNHYLSN